MSCKHNPRFKASLNAQRETIANMLIHLVKLRFVMTNRLHNKLDKKCKRPEANWMHELACRELNSDAFA